MTRKEQIITLLIERGIVGTNFKQPKTFKSGIRSPIYFDFRKSTDNSKNFSLIDAIVYGFIELFKDKFDVVMGVHCGGSTYASRISQLTYCSEAWVRPGAKPKNYGLGKVIEGADISGKRVLLIEDLISTGGSILDNAKIIRDHGASEVICASIFTYDFERSRREFTEAGFSCTSLINIHDILPQIKKGLGEKECEMLDSWVRDPEDWFKKFKLEFDYGFLTTLRRSTAETTSIICMGLDPVLEALPEGYRGRGIAGAVDFYQRLISEMKKRGIMPAMFKPNEGFYTKHNRDGHFHGSETLSNLLYGLPNNKMQNPRYSSIPKLIDPKRGDIGKSSQNYAEEYLMGKEDRFHKWDAITISPFMGTDSVEPFTQYCNPKDGKGVYILNKTSNPGSKDLQMAKMADGRYFYQHVSDMILKWAEGKPGVGAVVGGNSLEELRTILKFYAGKDIPVLVPGIDAQGGSAKDVTEVAYEVGFELPLLRLNSSSGITHPYYKKPGDKIPKAEECIEMSIAKLQKLNEEAGVVI